jgi:hypothetical protein
MCSNVCDGPYEDCEVTFATVATVPGSFSYGGLPECYVEASSICAKMHNSLSKRVVLFAPQCVEP